MKKSLFIALGCAFVMSFASCERCMECSYEVPVIGTTQTSGEICGDKDEIETLEETWEAAAAAAVGATATCVEK